MFRTAKPNQVFKDVTEQIEDAIIIGRFKPGDKLPPERELRQSLDISRATLRESLRGLEAKGLLEIRKGVKGGAYVKAASVDNISHGLDRLIRQHKVSLDHLYEFRQGVEGSAMALATERVTEADLHVLGDTIREMEEYLRLEQVDRFYRTESGMHQEIARISGNPVYEWVLSAVATNVHMYAHLLPRSGDEILATCRDWRHIVNAMANREVNKARMLIDAHVIRNAIYVQETSARQGQKLSDIILNV